MAGSITSYYNRYDPTKNYDRHMFRAGFVLQSAELNEIQDAASNQTKSIGDALFKDGDIVRDARIIADATTGVTTCESGAVYLRGQVRGVPPGTLTIPVTGTVMIGIYLVETTVTEIDDPTLLDPAAETRNYNEPGAARLRIDMAWGFAGDGQAGDFFPIYYADDGIVRGKEPPPVMDAVSQAIAAYDRDSTLSNYVVAGMRVSQMDDATDGSQVYDLAAGRARVNGYAVDLATSLRLVYPSLPVIRLIDSEPKTSAGTGAQRIDIDRPPMRDVTQVRITHQKTVNITRGPAAGTSDAITDPAVVDIISVSQGATTYVKNTDYKLTGGQVDWSLPGAEPATGSTYSCTYNHIETVTPTLIDSTGFTVTDAVPGTLVLSTYNTMLPRIDRLCLKDSGQVVWVEGISTDYNPVRPQVPDTMLAIAQVHQTWDANRYVENDGVRVVSMSEIEKQGSRIDLLVDIVAQNALASSMNTREAIAKKGLFVDPFIDDAQRDDGVVQGAAAFDGILTLPVAATPTAPSTDVTKTEYCAYVLEPLVSQPATTGAMKINPYMSFGIPPAPVSLSPAIDQWTETQTIWTSPVTRVFTNKVLNTSVVSQTLDQGRYLFGLFDLFSTFGTIDTHSSSSSSSTSSSSSSTSASALVASTSRPIQYLRQVDVHFSIAGFGPNEQVTSVTFDGLSVTPSPA